MPLGARMCAAALAATVVVPAPCLAGGEWPDGPNRSWFQHLQRPDNDTNPIPPEKIVREHAPDGQPYLFMLADSVQCFVRPKGGT